MSLCTLFLLSKKYSRALNALLVVPLSLFVAASFGVESARAQAVNGPRAILENQGALGLYSSPLAPSLSLASAGLAVYGRGGPSRQGRAAAALVGSFSFFRQPNPRRSGWSAVFAVSREEQAYAKDVFFAPAGDVVEVGVGRGTTDTRVIANSGLGGYLEMLYRVHRLRNTPELRDFVTAHDYPIGLDQRALVIRMGASTNVAGIGLVEQKAPGLGWAIQAAFHWPLVSRLPALFIVQTQAEVACPSPAWRCGLDLYVAHSHRGYSGPTVQDLENLLAGGPYVAWVFRQRYQVQVRARWKVAASHNASYGGGAAPQLDAGLTVGF